MSSPFTQSLHGFKRFWFPPPGEPNIEDVLVARIAIVLRVGAFLLLPVVPPLWLLRALLQGAVFNNFWLVLLVACPALCFPIGWVLMHGRVSLRSCLLWIAMFSAYWSTTFPLALKNRAMHRKYQAVQILMGSTASIYEFNEFAIRSFEKLPGGISIHLRQDRSAAKVLEFARNVPVNLIDYSMPWHKRSNEDLKALSQLKSVPKLYIEICSNCEGEVQRVSKAIAGMTGLNYVTACFLVVSDPGKDLEFLRKSHYEKRDWAEYYARSIHEEGFERVMELPYLKSVAIRASKSPSQYLDKLGPSSPVKEIGIASGNWQPSDLRKLQKFPKLKRLAISSIDLTDEHLAEISTLSKTRKLQFRADNLPEQFIADNPQIDFTHFVVGDGG